MTQADAHIVAEPDSNLDPRVVHAALSGFYHTGLVPPVLARQAGLGDAQPTLIAAYQEADLRGPFPRVGARSLTAVVDRLIDSLKEGDSGERQKRILLHLDRELRNTSDGALEELLPVALENVRSKVPPDWQEDLDAIVPAFSDAVVDQHLTGFGENALLEAARRIAEELQPARTAELQDHLERLLLGLRQLSEVDEDERDTDSKHLRDLTGGAFASAFDFDALGQVLDKVPHPTSLPGDRRERVDGTVEVLEAGRMALKAPGLSRWFDASNAARVMDDRLTSIAALGGAMAVAQYEIADGFDASRHTSLLDGLDRRYLDADTLRLVAPVLVRATEADLAKTAELLASGLPYKILLTLDHAPGLRESSAWGLAGHALHAADVFTCHAALSEIDALEGALRQAVEHTGPALLTVFAPADYLTAAAAHASRAFPFFSAEPAATPWVDRMYLSPNPASELDWAPVDTGIANSDGPFTWADFAALQPDCQHLFLLLPEACQSDHLRPACDVLDRPAGDIPYIWVTLADSSRRRAVIAAAGVTAMRKCRDRWRRLRALGGIDNSIATRAVELAKSDFDDQLAEQASTLKAQHETAMGRAVQGLANQIVTNIASSLLSGQTVGPLAPAGQPAMVVPDASPDLGETALVEENGDGDASLSPEPAADDDLGLDDAWIETARCTTCNECTDLNSLIFAYNDEKQAYIKDAAAGPYRDIVMAAEKCPAAIIHCGKPLNPDEPNLEEFVERARPFM